MENKDCIFCKIIKGEIPSTKVFEDEHTYAFLDVHPKSKHHALVIPKAHYENIFDIPADQAGHLMNSIKQITSLYKEKYGISNVNIINNSGKIAGQEVFHIHFHIVPRD